MTLPLLRYFPFGVHGILSGSAAFFSFVGFDAVTSTAEEVKNPHRDLPLGIGISVSSCCILYMLVSAVVVGLVPYDTLYPDTPISSAFASYGMEWAVYIITTGTVTSLCAALMGSILPQGSICELIQITKYVNLLGAIPVNGSFSLSTPISFLNNPLDVLPVSHHLLFLHHPHHLKDLQVRPSLQKELLSSKVVVIILLLCVILTTLVFIASVIFYVYQRNKCPIERPLFLSDKETSYNSASNLINRRATSVPEHKFYIGPPANPITVIYWKCNANGRISCSFVIEA